MGPDPCLIGIAGPSCSGKTELARGLARRFGDEAVALISIDSYYHDLSELSPRHRAARDFDHPDAVERDLLLAHVAELAAGRPVRAPVYDFATHTRASGHREIAPAPIVIVEGLFTLCWEDLRAALSVAVFLDAPHRVCLARRIERDVRGRARSEASVRRQYELSVAPMYDRFVLPTRAHADLVLDAGEPIARSVGAVAERILSRLDDGFSLPKGPSGS